MKNITLTADGALIEAARRQAAAEGTSLNEQFRIWLASYAKRQRVQRFDEVLATLRESVSTRGRRFTRDEMNER